MAKLATDTLLKKSVEDVLTELVNSTFDWQEYTDTEISDILEISDAQAMELEKIINDSLKANNKLWSSEKTSAEIQNSIIEANKYSDDLVANLSNIKLDIVNSLPDSSTVNKSTIYILKDSTGVTNNTLNVWSDATSAFIEVGKLRVSMDNYYTKGEVDTELAKKANADEVLKPDAIVSDLTTTSGSTTLSTAGLRTELDKKVDKSGILSSVSSTPNDDNVLSEKATKTELDKKADKSYVDDNFATKNKVGINAVTNPPDKDLNNYKTNGRYTVGTWTDYSNAPFTNFNGTFIVLETGAYLTQIAIHRYDGIKTRLFADGAWTSWV